MPEEFGNWNSVFQRFRRWAKKGVWEGIFNALVGHPDFEYLIIDSTVVRAHQHAAGAKGGSEDEAIGRSRGGLISGLSFDKLLADKGCDSDRFRASIANAGAEAVIPIK